MRPLFTFALLCCLSLLARAEAWAQGSATRPLLALASRPVASRPISRPVAAPATTVPAATAPAAPATVLLVGRVETAGSNLVGAVVEVAGAPSLRTVTNAAGEFQLQVPASAADLQLTASYGGFSDQTTAVPAGTRYAVVRLYAQHDIPGARPHELEAFLKTARKQVRHELRDMRRD